MVRLGSLRGVLIRLLVVVKLIQRKFKYRRRGIGGVDSVTQCEVKWVLADLRWAALRSRVG